jgi:chromosome segregation ATPase
MKENVNAVEIINAVAESAVAERAESAVVAESTTTLEAVSMAAFEAIGIAPDLASAKYLHYNGKRFRVANKQSGYGSGKKTVVDFELTADDGSVIVKEHADITTIKRALDGDSSNIKRARIQLSNAGTISGYCDRIELLYAEEEERLKEVKALTAQLRELEERYTEEDEQQRKQSAALEYLQGLTEEQRAAFLAMLTK